jgi:hypothetical protein
MFGNFKDQREEKRKRRRREREEKRRDEKRSIDRSIDGREALPSTSRLHPVAHGQGPDR